MCWCHVTYFDAMWLSKIQLHSMNRSQPIARPLFVIQCYIILLRACGGPAWGLVPPANRILYGPVRLSCAADIMLLMGQCEPIVQILHVPAPNRILFEPYRVQPEIIWHCSTKNMKRKQSLINWSQTSFYLPNQPAWVGSHNRRSQALCGARHCQWYTRTGKS